jgi:hypothetical protein
MLRVLLLLLQASGKFGLEDNYYRLTWRCQLL